jgi:hypothetical protein
MTHHTACFPETSRDAAKTIMAKTFRPLRRLQHLYGLPMSLDVEKYKPFLAEMNLSDQEQTELIQSVWAILEGFVDHAFGRHPLQQCGKVLEHNHLQDPGESIESAGHHPFNQQKPIRYEDLKRIDPP